MKNNLFDLKGYCSIMTGGAQGLGKYMAEALAEYGSDIVIADMNIKLAQKTAQDFIKKGVDALAVEVDVRDEKQIDNMVKSVLENFGKIDVLVNNAGIARHIEAENMDLLDWKEVMDVNLNGVFSVSKAVGKEMIKKQSGSIINISSMSDFNYSN